MFSTFLLSTIFSFPPSAIISISSSHLHLSCKFVLPLHTDASFLSFCIFQVAFVASIYSFLSSFWFYFILSLRLRLRNPIFCFSLFLFYFLQSTQIKKIQTYITIYISISVCLSLMLACLLVSLFFTCLFTKLDT